MTSTAMTNLPFIANRDQAPAFWMYNILWVPLAEGHQTGGSYSVIEQWMRKGSGAIIPHVHNFCDEWFYIIEGGVEFTVSGKRLPAVTGDSVWVARGTVHSFIVTSDVCHVLNGYTPAGFEQVFGRAGGTPRTSARGHASAGRAHAAADLQQLLDL